MSQVEHDNWTILDVLRWTAARLERQGLPSARLDAEVMLAHVLGVNRLRLYLDFDKPLGEAELASYRQLIRRRLAGEPVAYLTGCREFWSLELEVGPAVLVPRPETELLVELVLARLGQPPAACPPSVVDVGTGSGAIAIAVARERPDLRVLATDASAAALALARRNAERHHCAVTFYQGHLLTAVPPEVELDVVLSNLPYIPTAELPALMPDVVRFEPRQALDGGADGLDLIRELVAQAAARLRPAGYLALEMAPAQRAALHALLEGHGFRQVRTHRDLAGHERVVSALRP